MGDTYTDFMDLMKRPAVMEMMIDMLLCTVPIWLAVMIGLVIGWSWRPRWTGLVFLGLRSRLRFLLGAAAGLGGARLWFAFTAFSVFSVCRRLWSHFKGKEQVGSASGSGDAGLEGASFRTVSFEREQDIVSEKDLEHLLYLLDGKAGELAWQHQMERTTPNMIYQAWRHEPQAGPTIYRSRTVFEDATPDLVRDFFWDDDFRLKWDPMLAYYKILEDFPQNGTMIVHWIKKFPFFCSDREYIIGRRIWESVNTYFSVTKGVPYPSLPKNEKPRRVELYFSSWRIRAVESRKQDGQLSSCEVTLVHYEDMGIPRDVAKVGVRHGMWGTVKKLHSGMRAYQLMRKSEASLSRCAHMAQFTTQVEPGLLDSGSPGNEGEGCRVIREEAHNGLDWKWIVIGGTAAVVCGLHTGLIGKALLFGAARRLSRK